MEMQWKVERANLELKYCECCGGLWLRPVGGVETSCGACVRRWTDFATNWARGLKRRHAEAVRGGIRLSQGGRA